MKATVRKQIVYPYNIDYVCEAYPPRRGYLTVKKKGTQYKMYHLTAGKEWELVYPPRNEDGWVGMCKKQYIGPDLVMIDDYTYTTYIKLF